MSEATSCSVLHSSFYLLEGWKIISTDIIEINIDALRVRKEHLMLMDAKYLKFIAKYN